MMQLRQHQEAIVTRAQQLATREIEDWRTTLLATPGAGKSLCVAKMAEALQLPVIWVAPRLSLQVQGKEVLDGCGIPVGVSHHKPTKHGFVTNYMALAIDGGINRHVLAASKMRGPALVIADEFHHLDGAHIMSNPEDLTDDERAFYEENYVTGWGASFDAFIRRLQDKDRLGHLFLMSGTPYRQDRTRCADVIPYEPSGRDHNGVELQEVVASVPEYKRADAIADGAVIPMRVTYVDANVTVLDTVDESEVKYSGLLSQCLDTTFVARALRSFLSCRSAWQSTLLHATKDWAGTYGDHKPQMLVVARSIKDASGFLQYLHSISGDFHEQIGRPLRVGIAVSSDHLAKESLPEPACITNPTLDNIDPAVVKAYYQSAKQAGIYKNLTTALRRTKCPSSEEALSLFRHREMDILVTVGKAYEGLDAQGCTHLVHLGLIRSIPWLTQCFARAWRRDYHPAAPPFEEQRARIFIPQDARAMAAAMRIRDGDSSDLQRIKPTKDKEGFVLSQAEADRLREMLGDSGGGAGAANVVTTGHGEASSDGCVWDEQIPDEFQHITIEISEEDPWLQEHDRSASKSLEALTTSKNSLE